MNASLNIAYEIINAFNERYGKRAKDIDLREEAIREVGLKPNLPQAGFDNIYLFTLVNHTLGKHKNILKLFSNAFTKELYKRAFIESNLSILNERVEKISNWYYLSRGSENFQINSKEELSSFALHFENNAKKTKIIFDDSFHEGEKYSSSKIVSKKFFHLNELLNTFSPIKIHPYPTESLSTWLEISRPIIKPLWIETLEILGNISEPEAIVPISFALKEPDEDIRKEAVYALEKIGHPKAILHLKNLISESLVTSRIINTATQELINRVDPLNLDSLLSRFNLFYKNRKLENFLKNIFFKISFKAIDIMVRQSNVTIEGSAFTALNAIKTISYKNIQRYQSTYKNKNQFQNQNDTKIRNCELPYKPRKEPDPKFYFKIKGDRALKNQVVIGSNFELIFGYGIPDLLSLAELKWNSIEGKNIDFRISITPKGFRLRNDKWFKTVNIVNGLLQNDVVFRLRALDEPIDDSGLYISFDIKGYNFYDFFIPLTIVKEIDILLANDIHTKIETNLDYIFNMDFYAKKIIEDHYS